MMIFRRTSAIVGCLLFAAWSRPACAGVILLSGTVTQSTQDGTGPAVNNGSLNSIQNGDSYIATLTFGGGLSGPGLYQLTAAAFQDLTAGVGEAGFGPIWSFDVVQNGTTLDFSVVACLTTGTSCSQGNFLAANFEIPAAQLNGVNVAASPIFGLLPFELLEDDGTTDFHATIDRFSSVPEPGCILLVFSALAMFALVRKRGALDPIPSSVTHAFRNRFTSSWHKR
jgi:hypothetical protein